MMLIVILMIIVMMMVVGGRVAECGGCSRSLIDNHPAEDDEGRDCDPDDD